MKGTQHGLPGRCAVSCLPATTHPILSSQDSSVLWAMLSLQEPRLSDCEWGFFDWPFKGYLFCFCLFFLTDSPFLLSNKVPADFHRQIFCGLLFLALVLGWGTPGGVETPALRGDYCPWDIPLDSQPLQGQPSLYLCPSVCLDESPSVNFWL